MIKALTNSTDDKIRELKEKKGRIEKQIEALQSKKNQEAAKIALRRKIIVGGAILDYLNYEPEKLSLMSAIFDEFVKKKIDRETIEDLLPNNRMTKQESEESKEEDARLTAVHAQNDDGSYQPPTEQNGSAGL